MDTAYTTSGDLSGGQAAGLAAFMGIYSLFMFVIIVVAIAAMWKIFTKAGEDGWKAIIPIWNTIILLKIVGRPWWWLLLFFIPLVNIVVMIIVYNDLSKSFGHGMGFTLGLIFLNIIFFLILGFGGSKYVGPGGQPAYAGAGAGGGGYAPPPSYPPPAPQAQPPAAYPPAAPPAAPPYEPPAPPQV
jgi:hypothetical protein